MQTLHCRTSGVPLACGDKVLVHVFFTVLQDTDVGISLGGVHHPHCFHLANRWVAYRYNAVCILCDPLLVFIRVVAGRGAFLHQEHLAATPNRAHADYHGAATVLPLKTHPVISGS